MLKTVQEEKTSLKQPPKQSSPCQEEISDYYAHNYDHFAYETGLEKMVRLTVSRVDALGIYCGNDLAGYRREISDHVPIKLELDLKLRRGLRSHGN